MAINNLSLSEHICIQANICKYQDFKVNLSSGMELPQFRLWGYKSKFDKTYQTSYATKPHSDASPSQMPLLWSASTNRWEWTPVKFGKVNNSGTSGTWQWKIPILTIGHTSSNDGWSIEMLVFRKSISPKPSCCELKGGKFSSSMPANKLSHSDLSIDFHRQSLSVLPCIWVFSFHKTGHQTMVSMARWAMGAIL